MTRTNGLGAAGVQIYPDSVTMPAPSGEPAAESDGLSVVVALRQGAVPGRIASLEVSQTTLDFPPHSAPRLPLGLVVPLEFRTTSPERTVRFSSMVSGRAEIDGARRYTFQFRLKKDQDAGDLFRLFNRRSSYRAAPQKPIFVNIWPSDLERDGGARPVKADMQDVSATGAAIVVTPAQDAKIGVERVLLEFELPTCSDRLSVWTVIRYRVLLHSRAVRYGCAFDTGAPGFAVSQVALVDYLMQHQRQRLKYRG